MDELNKDMDLMEEEDDFDAEDFFEGSDFFEDDEEIEESTEILEPQGITEKVVQVAPIQDTEEFEDSDDTEDDDDEEFYFTDDDDVVGENELSYEEQMSIFASDIFSSVLSGEGDWVKQLQSFKAKLDPKLFRNEEYMIAKFMHKSMNNRILTSKIFEIILKKNLKDITKSNGRYITLDNYRDLNGAKEYGFIQSVIDRYKEYCNGHIMEMDEFEGAITAYKTLYQQIETVNTLNKGIEIATTGVGTGRNRKLGLDDCMGYVKKSFADLNGLLEDQEGKGFVNMKDTLTGEVQNKSEFICSFGEIETLNKAYGGYYTGNFYQFMGPPKGGKSKMCANVCYNAMTSGRNVTVWAQEGGMEMWSAQMRAIHCFRYTNKDRNATNVITDTPSQRDILQSNMSPAIKALEDASRLDLQTNPTYGSVEYIDRPFYLENFIEEIDTSVNSNGSQLVIIDYLQLIDTENPRLSSSEVLKQAYKRLLNYCKKKNVAVLTPVQYKQEAVAALASGDGSDVDMRVSAGGSAEVIRTPDMTIPLWATAQELQQGIEWIQPMPNRLGEVTKRIKLDIDLAHCSFVESDS